jgi:dsRNA-specific ribonuclease
MERDSNQNDKLFAKNILQQYCQKRKIGRPPHLPQYKVIEEGPSHKKMFKAQVVVGDSIYETEQWCATKKSAEIEAATIALQRMKVSETNVTKQTTTVNQAEERVKFFFDNFNSLTRELNLHSEFNSLGQSQQKLLKRKLTFAFLHGSVTGIPKCKMMIKNYLNLDDSQEVVDYNALECLGDAVLELVVTKYLYITCNVDTESEITKRRAKLVNRVNLNSVLEKSGLGKYIMYTGDINLSETSIYGDVLEAIIGAVYCVFGEQKSEALIKNTFKLFAH